MYSTLSDPDIVMTSDGRPKFRRLELSPGEKVINAILVIIHVILWIYVLVQIQKIPSEIPLHKLENGVTNLSASNMLLLVFPGGGLLLFVIFHILTWYPHVFIPHNIKITVDIAPPVYVFVRIYIRFLNIIMQLLLIGDSVIWIERIKQNEVPGVFVILVPTVGFVGLFAASLLVYIKNLKDEVAHLTQKEDSDH